jgi:serine/threonine-protein kinase RsbW
LGQLSGFVVVSVTTRCENIEVVQVVSDRVCEICGLDEDVAYDIGMALREGVANAMKHGNRWETEKLVEVRFGQENGALRIEIEDQGSGFDPSIVPDPVAPENRLRTSGRGILYVRSFMDRYDYRFEPGRGTVLVMEKKL